MKNTFVGASGALLGGALVLLYIFGMYKIVTDDHRYVTKDIFIGMIIFPYPWWVGGKETYRIVTTPFEIRVLEEKCLDTSESLGLRRKSRLRYCECLTETGNAEQCNKVILSK